MTYSETLIAHQLLCDEIHQSALDENRFIRQNQCAPTPEFLLLKRALLQRLDASLSALRELPAASARTPADRAQLENSRARILQILQLDKENEQLLLRCSLARQHPTLSTASPASASMLQRIYARRS